MVFVEVSPGIFINFGKNEPPNKLNGWAISNTGFIIGDESVLVIDAGPSYQYASEMIEYIKKVTNSQINYLVITHHHPDHSFGISKFLEIDTKVIISNSELKNYLKYGNKLLLQMKKKVGDDWFKNTSINEFNNNKQKFPFSIDLGSRKIDINLYTDGHSGGDLTVTDKKSHIVFSGDLVFNERAPTIPHANILNWLRYLDEISNFNWSGLVPGHGPIIKKKNKLDFTKKWIQHIHYIARDAVKKGLSPAEVLDLGVPEFLSSTKLAKETWNRDVPILMKHYENDN